MNFPSLPASVSRRCTPWRLLAAVVAIPWFTSHSAASTCTSFSAGIPYGLINFAALTEGSGLVVSSKNPRVLWTHNDGDRKKLYAVDFFGRLLARYDFGLTPLDMEDIAVGPGPTSGQSYLYVGDIGAGSALVQTRASVKIIRVIEPLASTGTFQSPPSIDLTGVETFTLNYPDGSYDAETLMVDPLNADVYVLTKQNSTCRLYRTNLNAAVNGSTSTLTFVRTVNFDEASAGDISFDGSQIILRNEDGARIWNRGAGVSISTALGGAGTAVPVIGRPTEPNGEAIAFLRDGGGYITVSEGVNSPLYYFQSQCPIKPAIVTDMENKITLIGGNAQFTILATGNPAPTYVWRHNGSILSGQTNATLSLTGVLATQGGTYQVTATNSQGSAVMAATLTVLEKPDLRITEVQSLPATGNVNGADWWELTSFESTTVNLNGWRFNDNADGLTGVFTIPNISIAPGETILFVEGKTPTEFRAWWGTANIPATTQIITYSGTGLSFGAAGDGVRLWNASATYATDTVASVDFGPATSGVTFNYDPVTNAFGPTSVLGVNGVFQAPMGGDIGSPGIYLAPLQAPALTVSNNGGQFLMDFNAAVGRNYSLEVSENLSTTWEPTGDVYHATANAATFFEKSIVGDRRFYRVRVN
jgi:hypothetical protein